MSDAAFLRAVLERPHDDGPRLVYADWLEERGECARAEFIRVQCELAGWQDGMDSIPIRGRHHTTGRTIADMSAHGEFLRRRERELWTAGVGPAGGLPPPFDSWPVRLPSDAPGAAPELVVCRGFVAHVSLTLVTLLGGPCERCNGMGYTRGRRPISNPTCVACSGTGRAPGVLAGRECGRCWDGVDDRFNSRGESCTACSGTGRAPGLFDLAPIEWVTVTDREPYFNGAGHSWFNSERPNPIHEVPEAANLPPALFKKLAGGRGRWRPYRTRDLAHAALSDAFVSLGRELAGLPPSVGTDKRELMGSTRS